jgi:hypothetical protein
MNAIPFVSTTWRGAKSHFDEETLRELVAQGLVRHVGTVGAPNSKVSIDDIQNVHAALAAGTFAWPARTAAAAAPTVDPVVAAEARVEAGIAAAVRAESARVAAIEALRGPGNGPIIDACLADRTCTVVDAKARLYDGKLAIERQAGREIGNRARAIAAGTAGAAPLNENVSPERQAGREAGERANRAMHPPRRQPSDADRKRAGAIGAGPPQPQPPPGK